MHIAIVLLASASLLGQARDSAPPQTPESFSLNSAMDTARPETMTGITLGDPLVSCPSNTLYTQLPNPPGGFFNAGTSEFSQQLRRADYFHGLAGAITGIRWWGLDLRYLGGGQWQECTETDTTFDVVFYADAGGTPGAPACTYSLVASRIPTGITYLGAELNEYQVSLPSPCILIRGWISLVGRGDPNCWFLWMSSTKDDDQSYCNGCTVPVQENDLSFCLLGNVGGVSGACCIDTTNQCNDQVDISNCTATNQRFLPNGTCNQLNPPCGTILGACCRPDATCDLTTQSNCPPSVGNWLGANTQCSDCPCIAPCPVNGLPEGEPICADGYVDTFNGGCNATLHVVEPIPFGRIICGTSGVYTTGTTTHGDWDYYEVQVNSTAELNWIVTAEFPFQSWVVNGGNGCPPSVMSTAQGEPCSTLTLNPVVPPGTYWLVVTPSGFTDNAACGARYTALAKIPVTCSLGDVNNDGSINGLDISCFVNCLFVTTPSCGDCRCADADQNTVVDTADIPGFASILLNAQ